MYAYFIDDWVYEKKYRRALDRFDIGVTQRGVSGKKIRLTRLHDLNESVRECFFSGVQTFVAVGNDSTASRLLNTIKRVVSRHDNAGARFTASWEFAVVPIDAPAYVARLFGVPSINEALEALASHRVKAIDAGLLNSRHYYLTAAIFPAYSAFSFDTYSVRSLRTEHSISVCNMNIFDVRPGDDRAKFCATDGKLEAVIAYWPSKTIFNYKRSQDASGGCVPESVFPVEKIIVIHANKTIPVVADAEKQLSTPVVVSTVAKAVRAIVGAHVNI